MRHAVRHLKASDPVLASIIQAVGPYRIDYRPPTFDTLVRSIVYQQVSGNVARAILERLRTTAQQEELTAPRMLELRRDRLRKAGLSKQKTEYIKELARHTHSGTLDFRALPDATDDAIIETLTAVKGIGVWTAQMFLIFALRRPDVLPTGDLGVRKAMQIAYQLDELPKPARMEEIAAPWRPFCSVASWYLWRSLDGIAGI
ncbi:MAG: DNA-3-methyladenine glycosylase 2 family protein [Bryobacterales bacterium]|nr:DNA-3-methyladenine glycosylase 2 family protein [Bryobacterales bacterium]